MTAHPDRLLQHVLALVPREASEAELLRRFVQGRDEDAFAALIARHGPMVFGLCRRLLRDAASAEDAAQSTFVALAREAGSVRSPGALAAWLHRTACHLALKQRRADARRRDREARGASGRAASDPAGESADRELAAAIDEEIGQLPERFRLPVILCGLEGRTLDEAAERLGWTPGSVKGRLERGRVELRNRLVRRGFALSAAGLGLDVLREGARASLPAGFRTATLRAAVSAGSRVGVGAMGWKVAASLLLTAGVLGGGVAAVSGPERAAPKVRTRVAPPAAEGRKVDRQGDALPAGALARLGTVRWRSPNRVDAFAFAPDGKTLAVATRHHVRLFDAKGKLTREMPAAARTWFDALSYSPDGKRLSCRCMPFPRRAKEQDIVRIWELGGGNEPQEFPVEGAQWVGWSATGEPLAILQATDAVVVRELASGKEHRFEAKDLYPPRFGLFLCSYAQESNRLAFGDKHAAIHVWDVSTGKKVGTVETKAARLRGLAISADGRSLASLTTDAGDTKRTVQMWDVATGKKTRAVASDPRYTEAVVFAPDDKTLGTVGTDVRLWDSTTGRERSRTPGTRHFGMKFAFSADSKTLATASRSGTALLWDVATAEPKAAPVGHFSGPGQIDFSPDGKRVATSDGSTLIVWEEVTGEPLIVVRKAVGVLGGGFSPDGSRFSCYADGRRTSYAVPGGRRVKAEDDGAPVRRGLVDSTIVRLSRDRKTILGIDWQGGDGEDDSSVLTTRDAATFKPIIRRNLGRVNFGVAVTSDLRLLARSPGGEWLPGGGPVLIEAVATGEHHQNLPQLKGQTGPMEFSPDGRLLTVWNRPPSLPNVLGQTNHTLKMWEVATASEILSLPTVMNGRVAFSPDGRLMAVSAPAGEIVLWDLRRNSELQRYNNFDADVVSLAFSPDGRRLVSALSDTTLLVWPVPALPKPRRLDAAAIAQAWDDLAGDPKKAFAARGALADSPAEAVALLKKHLRPVRPADAGELRRLLAELDDDRFAVREKARKALEALGDRAAEALRAALEKKPSAEARKRIAALLRRAGGPVADRETLRSLRAAGVLEDIGSPDARAVLAALAGGAAGARLTREAKAALERVGRLRR